MDLETDLVARAQELERWAHDWYERAVNRYDLTVIDEKASDAFGCSNTTLWAVQGIRGNYESYERIHTAFPDAHFHIDDLLVRPDPIEGDLITVWYTFTGTHTGPMVLEGGRGTIEPTGRRVRVGGASLLHLQDWRMVAARAISDMMQELGVQPPPPEQH